MPEEDAIVKYLDFDRNIERLTTALDLACD
jgi:hypothetical protein